MPTIDNQRHIIFLVDNDGLSITFEMEYATKIKPFRQKHPLKCVWHLHESYFAKEVLGLKATAVRTLREQTSAFIQDAKASHIDLFSTNPNEFGLCVQTYGPKEVFTRSSLQARYFYFVDSVIISASKQLKLVRELKSNSDFLQWFDSRNSSQKRRFERDVVQQLIQSYDLAKSDAKAIHDVIIVSNQRPRAVLRPSQQPNLPINTIPMETPSRRHRQTDHKEPHTPNKRQRTNENANPSINDSTPQDIISELNSARSVLPEFLRLQQLNKLVETNIRGFALIEQYLLRDGGGGNIERLPASHDALDGLDATQLKAARRNIKSARNKMLDTIPCKLFQPKAGDLLIHWVDQGERYSSGERINEMHLNFEKHELSNKWSMTDQAAHCIRHMIQEYNLSPKRFPGLMNCMAVLLLGRSLTLNEFPSYTTILTRMTRLHRIDMYRLGKRMEENMSKKTEHGFHRLWFCMTDDTEIHKQNRHNVIVTGYEETRDGIDDPTFQVLTTQPSVAKGSNANSDLNVETFTLFSNDLLKHFAGGSTDNASDAQLEIKKTFEKVMDVLKDSDDDVTLYGFERVHTWLGDFFHADALAMNHASNGAHGDTNRENHSQQHHRQLQMSTYTLYHHEKRLAQEVWQQILHEANIHENHPTLYQEIQKFFVVRERQQRWLVNQAWAKWLVLVQSIPSHTPNQSVFLSWAIQMEKRVKDWVRRVAGEIIVMALNKGIQTAYNFEAELGTYFETTIYWHSLPGYYHSRPGFRTLKLFELYYRFIAPWWTGALQDWRLRFPKTAQIVESIDKNSEKEFRISQIQAGIECGFDEIVKMSDSLFKPPFVFVGLLSPEHGPALMRVILLILTGTYKSLCELTLRLPCLPSEEGRLYYLLETVTSSLTHWFGQLGFHRPILKHDIDALATADKSATVSYSEFPSKYPVLFEALHVALGFCPSVTRLVEQVHGSNRANAKKQETILCADMRQAYKSNMTYNDKRERRKFKAAMGELQDDAPPVKSSNKKHDDDKQLQQMIGSQLLESTFQYTKESLTDMPSDFDVKKVKLQGLKVADQELDALRKERSDDQVRRFNRQNKTLDEWQTIANETPPDNDASWYHLNKEEKQRRADLNTLTTTTFWRTTLPAGGRSSAYPLKYYNNVVKNVLPYLWEDDMLGMTKGALSKLVERHVKAVVRLAKGEESSSDETKDLHAKIQNINLSNLDYYGILELFVMHGACAFLRDARRDQAVRFEARSTFLQSCGKTLLIPTTTQQPEAYEIEEDDDSDDENEEDNEEEGDN